MADSSLDAALAFVFAAEGGYVDDPRDPGGATNMGVTLRELTEWRRTAVTKEEVRLLRREEATAIYRANYWNVLRCGMLPPGLDLMAFDTAVNMGNTRAAKFLQTEAGAEADGSVGPESLDAVSCAAQARGIAALIDGVAEARAAFYRALPMFDRYGEGWMRRVDGARAQAMTLTGADAMAAAC